MKFLFLLIALLVANVNSVEQHCDRCEDSHSNVNTYNDDVMKDYHACYIETVTLDNVDEEVTTNTDLCPRYNSAVTMVRFNPSNVVTFIPNSLFTTFVNLEYLYIFANNQFAVIKPEYFTNANKLKNFHVSENDITTLDADLFIEASNLEHINLENNKIETIDKLAFNGLPNLQGVYLQGNKIANLHPATFALIANLNILELTGADNCVDQKFIQANQEVAVIEAAIQETCVFEFSTDELAAIEEAIKLAEEEKIAAELAEEERLQQEIIDEQTAQQEIVEVPKEIIEEPIDEPEIIEAPIDQQEIIEIPVGEQEIVDVPTDQKEIIETPVEIIEVPTDQQEIVEVPVVQPEIIEIPVVQPEIIDVPTDQQEIIDVPVNQPEIIVEPIVHTIAELEAMLVIANELNQQHQLTLEQLQVKVNTQVEEIHDSTMNLMICNHKNENLTSTIEAINEEQMRDCWNATPELLKRYDESVGLIRTLLEKQKADAEIINRLTDQQNKIDMQASFEDRLRSEIMGLVKSKLASQKTINKNVLDAYKLELEGIEAKLAEQKNEVHEMEEKFTNRHSALIDRMQDQRVSSQKYTEKLALTCQKTFQDLQKTVEQRFKRLEKK